jgi:hypothetical protein
MNQLAQSIGCNGFHYIDNRLACQILMSQDCAHSNEFAITHSVSYPNYFFRQSNFGGAGISSAQTFTVTQSGCCSY